MKGTHRALKRFKESALKASKNNTKTIWILKCDVKKFFASVDQVILGEILKKYITDSDVIDLIKRVTDSFSSTAPEKGLPLGNLTSQLLVNVYMNEFDQFIKHELKAMYYVRYADDFVIMSMDKAWLNMLLIKINNFLHERLALKLHPDKISIRTFASGVDFLGWVHFPDHRVLRTTTKRRMLKRLKSSESRPEVANSYLGLISHGNSKKLKSQIETEYNV